MFAASHKLLAPGHCEVSQRITLPGQFDVSQWAFREPVGDRVPRSFCALRPRARPMR